MPSRRWLWITLFIVTVALLTAIATSWTVVVVRQSTPVAMWPLLLLGSLGFLGALSALAAFFIRLLREMAYSQAHGEFLAQVSHELKTPLATLAISSQLLRQSKPPVDFAVQERLWQAHDRELQRLTTEVETLLEAARLEQRRATKRFWTAESRVTLNLPEWVERAWPMWQGILGETAQLRLEAQVPRLGLDTHEKLLELIVRNVLDNARKFARPDLVPEVSVRIQVSAQGDLLLEFADRGVGFTKKERKEVFRKFRRLPSGVHSAGTGLGLYFVKQAARTMGMRITAESDGPNQGARFRLTVPHRWVRALA